MTTDPVLLRLEEVERTLRVWKKMTAAAMCIGVLAGGVAVMAVRPARVIRVGDRDGSHALLRADTLLFVDGRGKQLAQIGAGAQGGQISLVGDGRADTSVQLSAGLSASLTLEAEKDKHVWLSVDKHSSELHMTHGQERVTLSAYESVDSSFSLGRLSGNTVDIAAGGRALGPSIHLRSAAPAFGVLLETGPRAASLLLSDDGRKRSQLLSTAE